MRIVETKTGFVLRLDPGEELLETLTAFARRTGLKGGSITGIGAVRDTTLGYLDPETREYRRKTFMTDMELVNLTANITWVDDAPFIHAHATISGADYIAYSGHLFSAEIAVTGELYVVPSDVALGRRFDPRTGAKTISDD